MASEHASSSGGGGRLLRPSSLPIPSKRKSITPSLAFSVIKSNRTIVLPLLASSGNENDRIVSDFDTPRGFSTTLTATVVDSCPNITSASNDCGSSMCGPMQTSKRHSLSPEDNFVVHSEFPKGDDYPSPKRQRSMLSPSSVDGEMKFYPHRNPMATGNPPPLSPPKELSENNARVQNSEWDVCFTPTIAVDLKQAYEAGRERLLYRLDVPDTMEQSRSVDWPPLVISVHTELVMQSKPSEALLISLLSPQCVVAERQQHVEAPNPQVPPGITLAVTRSVHVHVHTTELSCCSNQPSWCFSSRGLSRFGQDELVILVTRRRGELLPPLAIYRLYQHLYMTLADQTPLLSTGNNNEQCSLQLIDSENTTPSQHNRFGVLSHYFPFPLDSSSDNRFHPFLDNVWVGCIFFRPTHQCTLGLELPGSYLFGTLIHRDEASWARCLPLRLLLSLGKISRQYPTPLASDRERPPVLANTVEESMFIKPLVASSLVLPRIQPLSKELLTVEPEHLINLAAMRIRLCSVETVNPSFDVLEMKIPFGIYPYLSSFLARMQLTRTFFAIACGLDPDADSHLVCAQQPMSTVATANCTEPLLSRPPETHIATQAISIVNSERKVTGVSFVVFKICSESVSSLCLVEDGVLVKLPATAWTRLIAALGDQCEFDALCQNDSVDHADARVQLRWSDFADSVRENWTNKTSITKQINSTSHTLSDLVFAVPPWYQLVHWQQFESKKTSTGPIEFQTGGIQLAWSRVCIAFKPNSIKCIESNAGSLTWGPLADALAGRFINTMRPYVMELRTQNHMQLLLQLCLESPDRVTYQVNSVASNPVPVAINPLPVELTNTDFSLQLDAELMLVVQRWLRKGWNTCWRATTDGEKLIKTHPQTVHLDLEFILLD